MIPIKLFLPFFRIYFFYIYTNTTTDPNIKFSYEKELDGFWFILSRKNVTTNITINDTIKLNKKELFLS